jgi:hypothetical protein
MGKLWFGTTNQVRGLPLAFDSWSKVLGFVWELCGLTEALCAVVNTDFIEILAVRIWFLYTVWPTGFTMEDCVLYGNICYILDFKFSPCSESYICFFGYFPVVRLCFADVSKPSIRSIFKGSMWSMKCEWWEESVVCIYTVLGFARDGRANGGGRLQVLGGSEWKGRCGGGRYERSLSGGSQVIVYVPFVPIFFRCM